MLRRFRLAPLQAPPKPQLDRSANSLHNLRSQQGNTRVALTPRTTAPAVSVSAGPPQGAPPSRAYDNGSSNNNMGTSYTKQTSSYTDGNSFSGDGNGNGYGGGLSNGNGSSRLHSNAVGAASLTSIDISAIEDDLDDETFLLIDESAMLSKPPSTTPSTTSISGGTISGRVLSSKPLSPAYSSSTSPFTSARAIMQDSSSSTTSTSQAPQQQTRLQSQHQPSPVHSARGNNNTTPTIELLDGTQQPEPPLDSVVDRRCSNA